MTALSKAATDIDGFGENTGCDSRKVNA